MAFEDSALLFAVFLISLVFYICWQTLAERVVVIVVSLSLIYESMSGIMQSFEAAKSNSGVFLMMGSFSNPGPYGGFIAVCTAIAFAAAWKWRVTDNIFDRMIVWISTISGCLGIVVLPASMSRTAWVALVSALVIFLLCNPLTRDFLKRYKRKFPILVAAIIFVSIGAFCLKKESALGRFHIWEMEVRAIADEPITGHGFRKALGAYGDAQASYFESDEEHLKRKRIADCPEYVFNEYLRFGLEFGIPGLLLATMVVVLGVIFLLRAGSSLAFGFEVWAIFAFASYPLSVCQLCLLLSVFLGAAIGVNVRLETTVKLIFVPVAISCALMFVGLWRKEKQLINNAENKWHYVQRLMNLNSKGGLADELAILYPCLHTRYRFLYDYGCALYEDGRYDESNSILMEGAQMSSDPMFYNIMGKNFEAMGDFDEAQRCYIHSHFMVPSRLYPYILLMEMKDKQGDKKQALCYALNALSLPVNNRNMAMVELYERARKYYDENGEEY